MKNRISIYDFVCAILAPASAMSGRKSLQLLKNAFFLGTNDILSYFRVREVMVLSYLYVSLVIVSIVSIVVLLDLYL